MSDHSPVPLTTYRVELLLTVDPSVLRGTPTDWVWPDLIGCAKEHVEMLACSEEPIRWRCPVCNWDVASNYCPNCGTSRDIGG